jgi:MFS family permease
VTSYGALIRTPRVARVFSAMVVARMSLGIDGIALVLFLRHEGQSFAVAGAAAGAMALGSALGAPVAARLIDRLGPRVLVLMAVVHAAGLGVVIAVGMSSPPVALLAPLTFLVGASLPPISSVLRAAYGTLLAGEPALLSSAFALDAVATEFIFIAGPLFTAAVVWLAAAAAALVVSAGLCVAGSVWFLAELPREIVDRRIGHDARGGFAGALRSPGLRTIVFAMLPVGFAFGAIEVTLPAFADAQGDRQLAGVLIAIWSLGSALGGVLYGARPHVLPLKTVHLWSAAFVPIGMASLVFATSPLAMGFLVILAGLPIAPLIATRNELAGLVALPGSETEAFTWPLTALVSGVALGAAVAGALADGPGWRAAVAAAVAMSALGALVSLSRRGTLEPAQPMAVVSR